MRIIRSRHCESDRAQDSPAFANGQRRRPPKRFAKGLRHGPLLGHASFRISGARLLRTAPRSPAPAPSGATTRAKVRSSGSSCASVRSRQTSSVMCRPPPPGISSCAATGATRARDVVGDGRLEFDLDLLGRSGVDAERVGKRLVGQFLDRREAFLEQRHVLDPLDRERPDLAVLGHVGEQVQPALRVGQAVRMHEIGLGPVARLRMVDQGRLAEVERRLEQARRRFAAGADRRACRIGSGFEAMTRGS